MCEIREKYHRGQGEALSVHRTVNREHEQEGREVNKASRHNKKDIRRQPFEQRPRHVRETCKHRTDDEAKGSQFIHRRLENTAGIAWIRAVSPTPAACGRIILGNSCHSTQD